MKLLLNYFIMYAFTEILRIRTLLHFLMVYIPNTPPPNKFNYVIFLSEGYSILSSAEVKWH